MSVIVLASSLETPLWLRERQAGPGPWCRHMVCWGDSPHQSVWEITETGARNRRREETSADIPGGGVDIVTTKLRLKLTHLIMTVVLSMCYGMRGAMER